MRHASFGWGTESILRDVSFDIAAGQHVAVTGPVGCESAHKTAGSGGARISGSESLYCIHETSTYEIQALVRAIATRPAILLLDDVFSAMNKTTKTSMQKSCLGGKASCASKKLQLFMLLRTVRRPVDETFVIF
ncbi:hypothetical protein ACHAO1_000767 [Botrytis cinerea]